MSRKPRYYPLHQSPLYMLGSRSKLQKLLGLTASELQRIAREGDGLYRERDEVKNGKTRRIEPPVYRLKKVQARIAQLLSRIEPPDFLYCPVKGRSYISNAARHRGNRVVTCLDIRKYYPSTSSKRVFWFFNKVLGCERTIAATLTRLTTYQGHLPTGAPTSAILAYLAHYDVWAAIGIICREHGYTLSVYIDDVTISGSKLDPRVIWKIKNEIHRVGLRYHKEKHFVDRPAEVTGVIVAENVLLPPNRSLAKAKALRDARETVGSAAELANLNRSLTGLTAHIRQVRTHSGVSA